MNGNSFNIQFSCIKGLAITGVLAGHLGFPLLEMFVNYWHLPVFYFVSGYFFKRKHVENWQGFVKTRVLRLMVPFFAFSIVAILLHNILLNAGLIEGAIYDIGTLGKQFFRLLSTFSTSEQMIGAIWFLPSLFIVSIIALLAKSITLSESRCYEWGGVILTFLIGVVGIMLEIPQPYCIWQNLIVASIFLFGTICAENGLGKRLRHPILFILSVIVIVYALCREIHVGCQTASLNNITLWHPIVFLSGIVIVYFTCYCIKDSVIGAIFAYVGEFSFSIMALHFIAFKVVTLVHHYFNPAVNKASFPTSDVDLNYWAPMYMASGIILPIICSKLYSYVNAWRCNCCIQKSGAND